MCLEHSRCSVVGDDADRGPDHADGTDAGDAQVYVDVDADVGNEVEIHDRDSAYRSVSPSVWSLVCLPLDVHHRDACRPAIDQHSCSYWTHADEGQQADTRRLQRR